MSLIDVDDEAHASVNDASLQGRVVVVRYEDLLNGFGPRLRAIYQFLGFEAATTDPLVPHLESTLLRRDLRSSSAPLPRFADATHQLLDPLLERHGYLPEGTARSAIR